MPINDPIKRERVAPGSLAFDARRRSTVLAGQSSAGGVTTTQQFITNIYGPTFRVNTNVQLAERRLREVMRAMSNAESRANHYVGDWHHRFEWDTSGIAFYWSASTAAPGAPTKLQFNNEVLRAVGASNGYDGVTNKWQFRTPNEAAGAYHVDVALFIRVSPNDKIHQARLAVYRNGGLWRFIDMTNSHFTDRNHMEEIYMQGSCIVPLGSGDYLEAAVFFVSETPGVSGTASGPTDYYAYISGHRVSCDAEIKQNAIAGGSFNNGI